MEQKRGEWKQEFLKGGAKPTKCLNGAVSHPAGPGQSPGGRQKG